MSKFFLQHGTNPNAASQYGELPLHLALKQDLQGPEWSNGDEDYWNSPEFKIEYSLDLIDLDPDSVDEYIETHSLVEKQRLAILDILLNHPLANSTARDCFGKTPMHCVRYGTSAAQGVLTKLLQQSAEVCKKDSEGRTLLYLACSNSDINVPVTLLEYSTTLLDTNKDSLNALHYVARSRSELCIQSLLESTTDINRMAFTTAKDRYGHNALHHMLSQNGNVDPSALQCLLTNGVGVNNLNNNGESPVARLLSRFLLNSSDKARLAELLFQSGADTSFKTGRGALGLCHLSASSDQLDMEDGEVDVWEEVNEVGCKVCKGMRIKDQILGSWKEFE